jgi:hypothetical protein
MGVCQKLWGREAEGWEVGPPQDASSVFWNLLIECVRLSTCPTTSAGPGGRAV